MKKILSFIVYLIFTCSFALAEFSVHFLDVGHGDCAIIQCDGHTMVIDGGSAGKSDLLFSYLQDLQVSSVDAVVATHPDADHVGGLPAVFYASDVQRLYVSTMDSQAERHTKLVEIANGSGVPVIVPMDGESFRLGEATMTFIIPQVEEPNDNDLSLVLLAQYGENRFLFCADIEKEVENLLLGSGVDLAADVMKIAHHGTDASSSMQFLLAVTPEYAVVSGDSRYSSPTDEVPAKLMACGATLLHTMQNGNIIFKSDGKNITCEAENNFVGNINSRVFHRDTCPSADSIKEDNQQILYTRENAIQAGYRSCKNCEP